MQADMLNFAQDLPGPGAPGTVAGTIIAHSANYLQPEIDLGSGWVNFFSTDSGWQGRADLLYTLRFRTFNNDFTYFDAAGAIQTGNISGTAGFDGDDLYEGSWMQHFIRPRVQLRWFGDRVNLGAGLVLGNTITTYSLNSRSLDANNNVVNHGADEESTFTFLFAPTLEVGARWIAIPDRLDVLVGGVFNPGTITRSTTESVTLDASGNVPNYATSTTTTIEFGNASADLRFGATFHFNERFALDAITGVNPRTTGVAADGTQRDNVINFFGTGANNLFTFGRIMAVLTF